MIELFFIFLSNLTCAREIFVSYSNSLECRKTEICDGTSKNPYPTILEALSISFKEVEDSNQKLKNLELYNRSKAHLPFTPNEIEHTSKPTRTKNVLMNHSFGQATSSSSP